MDSNQEQMRGDMETQIGSLTSKTEYNQAEMKATVRASQDKMKAMINSLQSKLEVTIKNRM
jgi:hypothetical protein